MAGLMAPERKSRGDARLTALRQRLGLTQTEMAAKLGVTLRTYQGYEAGGTKPGPVVILIYLIEEGKW